MIHILYMLLGAVLVMLGILAAALSDRIRGICLVREVVPRERPARAAISVVEPVEVFRAAPAPAKQRAPRAEPKTAAIPEGGDDVIAALVASGFKKPVATEATWACSAAERATVENWVASALRRCARGGVS